MCGIAGIFNANGKPVSIEELKRMTDIIKHRGPDGEGYWTNSFIGFGHRRLSILDLSALGHQPMVSDCGQISITYNGEIYNFRELKVELERLGQSFLSTSDTEVVLKAYQQWGPSFVNKLNGMFAFGIWDGRNQTLFLARDRYGIKPLYYYYRDNTLVFASEIKSLLKHSKVSFGVSLPALDEYFSFQNIFSDKTLFEGVYLLPAGHTLSLELGDPAPPKRDKYWDYDFHCTNLFSDATEYVEELHRLFSQAVKRQLVSDVEIGCYLSGGIDSGAITSIAASTFPNLKSFTGGFDLSSASGMELGMDERTKAEFLSSRYRTEHYEVVLKAGDMERVMPKLIWHLEDLRVGQSYPNYYVSRLASKFVKVVLSGAGGDEMFAGYPWRYYRAVSNDDIVHYTDKYYAYWQRLIGDSQKKNFFRPNVLKALPPNHTRNVFGSVIDGKKFVLLSPEEYVNCSLYFESKTFLHGLLEVEDKLSMAHGLETRVPFLDNDLVDFAMRVPVGLKLKNLNEAIRLNENQSGAKEQTYFEQTNDGKILLRQAFSRYVPQDYSNAPKLGFSAPDATWFKGQSIDYIRDLLFDKKARIYDYIEPKVAQSLMNEHFSGTTNRRLLIWSLLCFEWWNRVFDPRS